MLLNSYISPGIVLLAGISSVISAPFIENSKGSLAERSDNLNLFLPRSEFNTMERRGGDKDKNKKSRSSSSNKRMKGDTQGGQNFMPPDIKPPSDGR